LAERITTGFEMRNVQIDQDEFGPWPSEVVHTKPCLSTKAHEAVLGVNKFWTILKHRRNGYGKLLLDEARKDFICCYTIPRIHVAWTQTTDEGNRFAKHYLQDEANYDYLVYNEI
jgi:hypothetical protein